MKKLALVGLITACGSPPGASSAPPGGFPEAVATADCAPFDGPATSIYLIPEGADSAGPLSGEASAPHIRISIYRDIGEIGGQTFEIEAAVTDAVRCSGGTPCESATGGRVRVDEAGREDGVAGEVHLEFETGGPVSGSFDAPWREPEFEMFCG